MVVRRISSTPGGSGGFLTAQLDRRTSSPPEGIRGFLAASLDRRTNSAPEGIRGFLAASLCCTHTAVEVGMERLQSAPSWIDRTAGIMLLAPL